MLLLPFVAEINLCSVVSQAQAGTHLAFRDYFLCVCMSSPKPINYSDVTLILRM